MRIDIFNHLELLDHGQLADLVSNAKIIELVNEVQRGRGESISRGKIIADALGGAQVLLQTKNLRNKLFLTLSPSQHEVLKLHFETSDLYNLAITFQRKKKLLDFFGVDFIEEVEAEADKEAVGAVGVNYGLFEHQSVALLKAFSYLTSESKKVMLHMPTGAGKTRTAMHLIARHLNTKQKGIVVWLVHGKELCTQASSEFRKAWSMLGERPVPIIELWGGKTQSRDDEIKEAFEKSGRKISVDSFDEDVWPIELDDAVIIASIDSLNGLIDAWEPGERVRRNSRVSLVVFDEAHRAIARTYKRAIESIGPDAALLGLSATPGRRHYGQDRNADTSLVELFGGNKVELQFPGYNSPVEALIENGYLARLEKERLNVINSSFSPSDIERLRRKLSSSLDIDESFLKIVGLDAIRNLQIVKKAEELVDNGHKRIIIFAPSVEASNIISNIISSIGIKSKSITSNTLSKDRSGIIESFLGYSSDPYILCNYGVLTTGFDAPKTSAVIIGRPTTSIVLLNQMAGRAIRGPKVGGNSIATLVTVVDTSIPELTDTVNQFHAFDDSWSTT